MKNDRTLRCYCRPFEPSKQQHLQPRMLPTAALPAVERGALSDVPLSQEVEEAIQAMLSKRKVVKSYFSRLPVAALRDMCERRGLAVQGTTKAALQEALVASVQQQIDGADSGSPAAAATASIPTIKQTQTAAGEHSKALTLPGATLHVMDAVPSARVSWLGTSSGNPTSKRNVSCIAGTAVCPESHDERPACLQ
jgi:hypothetical protein